MLRLFKSDLGWPALKLILLVSCVSLLSACSQLGAYNAFIPKDNAARIAHDVEYGPEPRQRLDIYAPPKSETVKGTVVFIYGGSWDSGAKEDYGFVGHAFAAQGYTTAIVDYRLVPTVRYPGFVHDTAKAVAWVKRHITDYGGKSDRVFIVGHSAGAYNVMMTAIAPQFLLAEGLPPSSLAGAIGLSGPYDFLPLEVDATKQAFGSVKNLPATQPVNLISRGPALAPILLATGLKDETVLPRNSERLARNLKARGKVVELREYPDLGHIGTLFALSKPFRGRAPVLEDVIDFMERH